jgi:SAM-dependent methyltransferase
VSQEHWSAYYRGGALVSCPTNPEPGYAGRVRDAWARFFSDLRANSAVLDLGTGNGPVLLIAREASDAGDLGLRLTGVDLAAIDPVNDVPDGARLFEGIEFHAGVSTEALPFGATTFDAVSGQFIVEYTDTGKSLDEVVRVLAPGGRLQLILHHADSLIVANARESLRQAELVRAERMLARADRYFERSGDPGAAAESARRKLIETGKTLEAAAEASANPLFIDYVLRAVTTLLEHHRRLSRGELVRQLKRLDRELALWERRLADLVGAAMDEVAIDAFAASARDAGLKDVSYETQVQDGDVLIGWRMTARKPAAA